MHDGHHLSEMLQEYFLCRLCVPYWYSWAWITAGRSVGWLTLRLSVRAGHGYSRWVVVYGLTLQGKSPFSGLWSQPSLLLSCVICGAGWMVLWCSWKPATRCQLEEASVRSGGHSREAVPGTKAGCCLCWPWWALCWELSLTATCPACGAD